MDRHGLLSIWHKLNRAMCETQAKRIAQTYEWKWDCTAVVYPESKCFFCKSTIRSSFIWLLKGEKKEILLGQLYFEPGKKVRLLHIPHAHMIISTMLCLGRAGNGVDLLSSEVYPGGASMAQVRIPHWYKRYWNHDCPQMRAFITKTYEEASKPTIGLAILKELDAPWSISSGWVE